MSTADASKLAQNTLRALQEAIDVPPSKYEEAKEHYEAVGSWLGDSESELAHFSPTIYPQGSFALGTAIRPLADNDYDVDAVCLVQQPPRDVSQKELKEMVGARLKQPGSRYRRMLNPEDGGRRCWTIDYSDDSQFHLDVLPGVPDEPRWFTQNGVPLEFARHAIRITDKKTWDRALEWPKSNPRGYALWFRERMIQQFEVQRNRLAKALGANVEQIEDFRVRTPLQRVIQLLKMHRDIRYSDDADKPVSIIITTIAAQSYGNESRIEEALLGIIRGMRDKITLVDDIWWVANPVNPQENFADKWNEVPRKRTLFFDWLNAVEAEHRELIAESRDDRIFERLQKSYGNDLAAKALATSIHGYGSAAANSHIDGPYVIVGKREDPSGAHEPTPAPSKGPKPWGHP